MQPRFQYVLAALLVANLAAEFVPRPAQADGSAATNNVPGAVPYTGRLELDGVPYNGEVSIRFDLFDGPADASPDWTGQYTVNVFNGAFSVLLGGESGALANTLQNADAFELGLTLLSVGGVALDTPVALAGRQRLLPVPYALHAAEAADFAVNRDLAVARNLDVTGTSRLRGAVTADGTVAATGALSGASLSVTGAVNAGLSITAGTLMTAASADINGVATAHSLTLDGASNFISGSGASWAIRNGATNAMNVESDGDVAFARSVAITRGIAVAGAPSVQPTPLSTDNLTIIYSDDLYAYGTGAWICDNNALMRGVQATTQNVRISLPFGPVDVPAYVVRPICTPAN